MIGHTDSPYSNPANFPFIRGAWGVGANARLAPGWRWETDELGWLARMPIVSVLIAVAMFAVPVFLGIDLGSGTAGFDQAREDARAYFVRNPRLDVDPIGERMLGAEWLAEALAASQLSGTDIPIDRTGRMFARSQANLDALVEEAYDARMKSNPAWRVGVLDASTPTQNYFVHAFFHERAAGVALCLAVLLLVAVPLERTWGSLVLTVFVASAIPLSAHAFRLLDAGSGVPWSGSAGLAGALVGAYFIRGLGGHFVLPGWILLPAWLGVEAFVVRDFWLDDLGSVPWASLCASIGFGALVAGALRLVGFESKLDGATRRSSSGAVNPIVSRAARLRSDGDPHQAYDLIQVAWREDPRDRDVAEAFFSIAVEVGKPDSAAEAIAPSLRFALRCGDMDRALEYWLPLAAVESDLRLEPTASVRLGEALLDAGHPEEALFSLRGALDAGVSSAHATRIVHIARDLDESLARQAATIALGDPTLDQKYRAEFEAIANSQVEAPIPSAPDRVPARGVTPPIESAASVREDDESNMGPDNEEAIVAGLDPGALSADHLVSASDSSSTDTTMESPPELDSDDSGDVLSHWNDPSAIEAPGEGLLDDLGPVEELLGAAHLEGFDESFDIGPAPDDFFDPAEAETDSDMTPLLDATDELTSPLAAPLVAGVAGVAGATPNEEVQPAAMPVGAETVHEASKASPSVATRIMPNVEPLPSQSSPPSAPNSADVSGPESAPPTSGPASCDEFAIGVDETPRGLRSLKALTAVPVDARDGWIEIDVEGRGKTKLPLERIQAIVMAGVSGIATRPILVVDLALNWTDAAGEPLKVIRLRSDQFDPRRFEPGEVNPLEALTAWVRRLQIRTEATCLPSRDILEGVFARYDSVEAYENEVLMAMRDPNED